MEKNKRLEDFIQSKFAKLDVNKDGKLSYEEVRKGVKDLKLPYSENDIDQLIKDLDVNKDGEISFEEFRTFSINRLVTLRKLFDELDTNKNGLIEINEVKTSLEKLSLPCSDGDLKKLLKKVDTNHDGNIDFDEWHELLFLIPSFNLASVFRYWSDVSILDEDGTGIPLPQTHKKSFQDVALSLAAGGVAGGISRTCVAPLERLKILYQVQTTTTKQSLIQSFVNIYKEGGIRAYYQGNFASVLKIVPENAIKFFTYELVKRSFADSDADLTAANRLVAGATAGVVSHASLFPLEVIKTRLAVAPSGTYKGISDVVVSIMRNEGTIKPFYRGITASLMSTIPHSAIDLTCYEMLKKMVLNFNGGREPGVWELLGCAGASSTVGQVVAYPFHLVKTRLISKPKEFHGIVDTFKKTVGREGMLGLYKGLLPSFIKSVPAHGITFVVYEYFKRYLHIEKTKKH